MINPVVVNADDLGLSKEINEGIFKGIEKGVISDASLMIEAPYAPDALERLKVFGAKHVGLHIDLDEQLGWSSPGRERFTRSELMSMLSCEDFLASCRTQVRSQIEKVMNAGLFPTHVDTHHHVHGFFPIFTLILDLVREYRIPAMRFSTEGYTLTTREPIPFHASLYQRMQATLEREQILFCGSMVEGAGRVSEIGSFPAELVVHPSSGGEPWRSREMETLLSDAFRGILDERSMHLVSYKELIGKRSEF